MPVVVGPLRVDVVTLFPRMIEAPLAESILGKAQVKGLLKVRARDLRTYAEGRHRITDDAPYGGGAGMVMKPEPLLKAIDAARDELGRELAESGQGGPAHVVLLDPQGTPLRQDT